MQKACPQLHSPAVYEKVNNVYRVRHKTLTKAATNFTTHYFSDSADQLPTLCALQIHLQKSTFSSTTSLA